MFIATTKGKSRRRMMLARRDFLADFLVLMGAAAIPLRSDSPAASMTVSLDQEIAPISPLIYSHFTEHIGRVVYEGIWVGADSKIPNREGIRLDVLQALKRIQPAAFRWPGGCF